MKYLIIALSTLSLLGCSKGSQFVGTWQNLAESTLTLQITRNNGGEGFSVDQIESIPAHEKEDIFAGGKIIVPAIYHKESFAAKLDGEVLNVTLPFGIVTPAKVQGDTLIFNDTRSCDKCDTYKKLVN
jgi:hypothetical protein